MRKTKIDPRTLETQLRSVTGNDFCTYADIQTVTGLSYKQVRTRIRPALEPIPHIKPRKYLSRHVANVLAG